MHIWAKRLEKNPYRILPIKRFAFSHEFESLHYWTYLLLIYLFASSRCFVRENLTRELGK